MLRYEVTNFLVQEDREVAEKYLAHGTPSAVLIRPDGTIASYVAFGSQAIIDLARRVTAPPQLTDRAAPPQRRATSRNYQLPIGQPAPAFSLPDLSDRQFSSASLKGRRVLLLFWNPGCGFCQKMLPDLKSWESEQSPEVPQLILVSSGSSEANRAMGLRSPVLLDSGGGVARAFGSSGTPSAVLLDSENRIASTMGVVAPEVLALARLSLNLSVFTPISGVRRSNRGLAAAHSTDLSGGAAYVPIAGSFQGAAEWSLKRAPTDLPISATKGVAVGITAATLRAACPHGTVRVVAAHSAFPATAPAKSSVRVAAHWTGITKSRIVTKHVCFSEFSACHRSRQHP